MNTPPLNQSPINTVDLIGHEGAEQLLLDAVGGGRLHHAWLITGPRGVGKATLAYRFARYVLAHPPGTGGGEVNLFGDPVTPSLQLDPEDPVFRRVAAGSHGDLLTVACGQMPDGRPRSEIVVDDVRAVGDFFSKTSAEGGWRVAVVDGADLLNRSAANALLKVLEEPPARALLLLVAHAPGRVLPTILSRCRRLALRPLEDGMVDAFVAGRHPDASPEDRRIAVALAEGSPGRAAELIAQGGVALYRKTLALVARLPQVDYGGLNELANEIAGRGGEEAFRQFTMLFGGLLTRAARAAGGAPHSAIPEEAEVLARLGRMASLDRWFEVWEKSSGLLQRADGLDRRQVAIGVFHDLATLTRA